MKTDPTMTTIPTIFRKHALAIIASHSIDEFQYILSMQHWSPLLANHLLRLKDEFLELEEYMYVHYIHDFLST